MPRLPIPGQDGGTWGDILNEFLQVAHNNDGTLRNIGLENIYNIDASGVQDGDGLIYDAPSSTWVAANFINNLDDLTDVEITNPEDGDTLTYNAGVSKWQHAAGGSAVPAGAIMSFMMNLPPDGWLECNGEAVSRTQYADLFAILGTDHGNGDGSTTFNLPDLRGEFLRGWDNGRGIDTARDLGSTQVDLTASHTHDGGSLSAASGGGHGHSASSNSTGSHGHGINARQWEQTGASGTARRVGGSWASNELSANSNGNHSHTISIGTGGAHTHSVSGTSGSSGGAETRPRNIAVMYCIKY